MGNHLINGEFQSDKYAGTPRGFAPLKCTDKDAQDPLWDYAQRHRPVDREFSADVERALAIAGFVDPHDLPTYSIAHRLARACVSIAEGCGPSGDCPDCAGDPYLRCSAECKAPPYPQLDRDRHIGEIAAKVARMLTAMGVKP